MKMAFTRMICLFFIFPAFYLGSCEKDKVPDAATDITKGKWQSPAATNLPEERHECSFVYLNNKGYLIGGRGDLPVEEYDITTRTWKKLQGPPQELNHFQAVAMNNEIWLAGGFTGGFPDEKPVRTMMIFNPQNNQWRNGPDIPAGRRRGSAGVFLYNGKVYLVCGIINGHLSGHVSWFDEYDPASGQWKQLPDAPHARDHFNAAVVNNKLYLAGGRRTSEATGQLFDLTVPEVDVFDFETFKWSTLPAADNIPTQRAGCTAVAMDDYLVVIGGESVSQVNAHAQTEAYDTNRQQWITLNGLNRGRHGTQAFVSGDKIYIAAGSGNRGGGPELNTVEVYSPD